MWRGVAPAIERQQEKANETDMQIEDARTESREKNTSTPCHVRVGDIEWLVVTGRSNRGPGLEVSRPSSIVHTVGKEGQALLISTLHDY